MLNSSRYLSHVIPCRFRVLTDVISLLFRFCALSYNIRRRPKRPYKPRTKVGNAGADFGSAGYALKRFSTLLRASPPNASCKYFENILKTFGRFDELRARKGDVPTHPRGQKGADTPELTHRRRHTGATGLTVTVRRRPSDATVTFTTNATTAAATTFTTDATTTAATTFTTDATIAAAAIFTTDATTAAAIVFTTIVAVAVAQLPLLLPQQHRLTQ